jgi:hypothetical protein
MYHNIDVERDFVGTSWKWRHSRLGRLSGKTGKHSPTGELLQNHFDTR